MGYLDLNSSKKQLRVTIVIDAFRAFTTACYVLERHPTAYLITPKCTTISRLTSSYPGALLIGKPEVGFDTIYHIPNSPTRVKETPVTERTVLHRTEAGAKGIMLAETSDLILATAFVNVEATARYLSKITNPKIIIVPMGHEGQTPSLEDNLCAEYLESLLQGGKSNLDDFLPALRTGSGRYFFSEDQWQYPREDFERCLKVGGFNFAIRAVVQGDYASLSRL